MAVQPGPRSPARSRRRLIFIATTRRFLTADHPEGWQWTSSGNTSWLSATGNATSGTQRRTLEHLCSGRLQPWQVTKHLSNDAIYGVWGGNWTYFRAIDLDLHNGNQDIFLEQLQVLLNEFHGQDRWHFQVSDENAGGVHLFQVLRDPVPVQEYRATLGHDSEKLDVKHPDLAAKAQAAGMKTLGELEVFPDPGHGFRLPLCKGRTMLLDKPLEKVYDKRLKKIVPDVIGYITWPSNPTHTCRPTKCSLTSKAGCALNLPIGNRQAAKPEARKEDQGGLP